MRIVLVGATGTIGSAAREALLARHEVVGVGHSRGERRVDITSTESIRHLMDDVAPFDALISTAGPVRMGRLGELQEEDFRRVLQDKVMANVNLVRAALAAIREGGSITLTSGILAREPWPGTAAAAMANGAIDSFVRAASLDMPRAVRINAVSPVMVTETARRHGLDTGGSMSAAATARAYVAAVEGRHNGEVLDCREFH